MAIIKELQKVAPFGWIENRQPPVVEDEELNATDGFEQAAIAAIASSEGKRLEEARDAMILDRAIVAASFVAEGASNPAFAQPGCPCDEQVLIAVDPVAADESGEDGAVDAAWRAQAANLRRVVRRLVSRSAASRSTRSPTRSSNDRASRSGDRRCSSKALAIPIKPSVISRSWVGWVSIEISMVQWK
jgi:hypothetical protein